MGSGNTARTIPERAAAIQRIYAKVVSVFITGYLVGKLDHLFQLWFDPEYGPLVLRPSFALRMMVGIAAFLLAAVSTYVSRKYLSFGPGAEQPTGAK
jgi:hypothetical protein